jgi:hypothetical protein
MTFVRCALDSVPKPGPMHRGERFLGRQDADWRCRHIAVTAVTYCSYEPETAPVDGARPCRVRGGPGAALPTAAGALGPTHPGTREVEPTKTPRATEDTRQVTVGRPVRRPTRAKPWSG